MKVPSAKSVNSAGGHWRVKLANLCGASHIYYPLRNVIHKQRRGWKQGTPAEQKVTDARKSKLLVSDLFSLRIG